MSTSRPSKFTSARHVAAENCHLDPVSTRPLVHSSGIIKLTRGSRYSNMSRKSPHVRNDDATCEPLQQPRRPRSAFVRIAKSSYSRPPTLRITRSPTTLSNKNEQTLLEAINSPHSASDSNSAFEFLNNLGRDSETLLRNSPSYVSNAADELCSTSIANPAAVIKTENIAGAHILDTLSEGTAEKEKITTSPDDATSLTLDIETSNNPPNLIQLNAAEPHIDELDQCPFCDALIDIEPSKKLLKIYQELKSQSYVFPTSQNLHHRAGLSFCDFQRMCERHEYESIHKPLAAVKGWPTRIRFAKLYGRTLALHDYLKSVTRNLQENSFFSEILQSLGGGSLRSQSILSRFAKFRGVGAGYYGQEGYHIIALSLSLMFPDGTPELDNRKLTWNSLIHDVLLPEVVVQLIQQDFPTYDRATAIETLQESSQYGNIRFHNGDSVNVQRVQQRVADVMRRSNDLYDNWKASNSTDAFETWVQKSSSTVKEANDV